MKKQYLYEFRCDDEDCGHHFLAMNDTEYGPYCPYCGESADYAPGKNFPVLEFTPGTRKIVLDI